jgi:josephin
LDEICLTLTPDKKWLNPHRSFWGTGNFDVNVRIFPFFFFFFCLFLLKKKVLMAACQHPRVPFPVSVTWFDRRKTANALPFDNPLLVGFIVNVRKEPKLFGLNVPLFKANHWFTILPGLHRQHWWNLDSKLDQAERFEDSGAVVELVEQFFESQDGQVFVVEKEC